MQLLQYRHCKSEYHGVSIQTVAHENPPDGSLTVCPARLLPINHSNSSSLIKLMRCNQRCLLVTWSYTTEAFQDIVLDQYPSSAQLNAFIVFCRTTNYIRMCYCILQSLALLQAFTRMPGARRSLFTSSASPSSTASSNAVALKVCWGKRRNVTPWSCISVALDLRWRKEMLTSCFVESVYYTTDIHCSVLPQAKRGWVFRLIYRGRSAGSKCPKFFLGTANDGSAASGIWEWNVLQECEEEA